MNTISAQHATLLIESTKRAKEDEARLRIPFKPRHGESNQMANYKDKIAITTGEFEPSDDEKLLNADPDFKKFLDSLDHLPF